MGVNRNITELVEHLEKFTGGKDVSVQWAKDAESILDQLGDSDEVLDELQDFLAFYRPEGGPHLYNKDQMDQFCRRIIPLLRRKANL